MSGKSLALIGGKAKIGAISLLLVLIVGLGALYLSTNPNISLTPQDQNKDLPRIEWTPPMPPQSQQSGLNSWARGETGAEMSQSLGSYIGMSGSNFFGLGNNIATSSEQAVAELNESEAIDIALGHAKVNGFVETYDQVETWVYFDGSFWHVEFFETDTYANWAYVMIRDKDAVLVQVYIIMDGEVYLEWPAANLDASTALGLANENPIIQQFLQDTSFNISDAWVWFDGDRSWYVDFYPYILTYAEDSSMGLNNQANRGTQQDWGEILPSQPVEDRLAYDYETSWLTAIIDDIDAQVRSIYTSYFDFPELNNNPETARDAAKTAPEAQNFWERHADDYVFQDVYLEFNYSSTDSQPNAIWWVNNYVWPQYVYAADSSTSLGQGTIQLPSQVKGIYYWAFDYMTIALADDSLETEFIYELPQPQHSYEEVLQTILDQAEIAQFIDTYQEVWITIMFDPFTSTWWSGITPTWTWMAYAFLEISDDQTLTINDLWIEDIPSEQMPDMKLEEVRAIYKNSTYYQTFNQTYSQYGEIEEYVYYYYDDLVYDSSAKTWSISLYSNVILEAYAYMEIDDSTGEFIDYYAYAPDSLPVHTVDEVLNFTKQNEDVQNFLNAHDDVITEIYFLSYDPYGQTQGRWVVYYYTPQYDAVMALEVQDNPLVIINMWTYP